MSRTYATSVSASGGSSWVFDSTPTGTVNGSNTVFTIAVPASQVIVYADGLRMKAGVSYTFSTPTITFINNAQPFSSISVDYLPL